MISNSTVYTPPTSPRVASPRAMSRDGLKTIEETRTASPTDHQVQGGAAADGTTREGMRRLSSATREGARTLLHSSLPPHSGASVQGVHRARARAHAPARIEGVSAAAPGSEGGRRVVRGGGGLGAHESIRSSPLPPGVSSQPSRSPREDSARLNEALGGRDEGEVVRGGGGGERWSHPALKSGVWVEAGWCSSSTASGSWMCSTDRPTTRRAVGLWRAMVQHGMQRAQAAAQA